MPPVESFDLGQHEQVARTGERRPGRKQPAEAAGPCVLQSSRVVAYRHRHVGFPGGDTEFIEKPAQGGVGAVIVHEERGVDANGAAVVVVQWHLLGVGVPAQSGVGLVEGHAVALCQHIRCDQA